jgi:hypothetical protein
VQSVQSKDICLQLINVYSIRNAKLQRTYLVVLSQQDIHIYSDDQCGVQIKNSVSYISYGLDRSPKKELHPCRKINIFPDRIVGSK